MNLRILWILIIMAVTLSYQNANAKGNESPPRQKVIDFEGDLVEGVNKRPLDSLSEISEAQKRKRKMHLYRKRKGFRTETLETLRELRSL